MKYTYVRLDVLCTTKNGEIELVRQVETGLLAVRKTVPARLFFQYKRIRKIHHRNLVQIYEVKRQKGQCIIIEEYVDGETLTELLEREGKMEWRQAAEYLYDLCLAVCALHRANIVHRDVNPNNIMITRDGILKLYDYNISQVIGKRPKGALEMVGTVGFAPPEQYGYGMTGVQTDIYAMGMTVNRMLMGQEEGCYWEMEGVEKIGDIIRNSEIGEDGKRIKKESAVEEKAALMQVFSQMVFLEKSGRYETAERVLDDLYFLLYEDWEFEDFKEWGALSFFAPGLRQGIYQGKLLPISILYFFLLYVQSLVYEMGGMDGTAGRSLCIIAWLLFFDIFRISWRIFRLSESQRWFRYVIGLIFLLAATLAEGQVF